MTDTPTPTKPVVEIMTIVKIGNDRHQLVINGHIDVLLAIAQHVRSEERKAGAAINLLRQIVEGGPPPEGVTVSQPADDSAGPTDESGEGSGFEISDVPEIGGAVIDKRKKRN